MIERKRPSPVLVGVLALSALGCVETTATRRLADDVRTSPAHVELVRPASRHGSAVWIGVDVVVNESDSLEDLEVLPGARVRRVSAGGPAALAGIEPGDVILSVGGVEISDGEGLAAALASAAPGDSIVVRLRRDTLGIDAVVQAAAPPESGLPPRVTRRIDPVRTRAAYRTVRLTLDGTSRLAVEVDEVRDGSPFVAAGVRSGDVILALDGEALSSAQQLVTVLIDERQPGDSVELVLLRGTTEEPIELGLWAPPRRLSSLVVPILFTYERGVRPSRTTFRLIDLWLLAFYAYEREEGEREHSVLGLFRWGSGYGELSEVTPEGEGAG